MCYGAYWTSSEHQTDREEPTATTLFSFSRSPSAHTPHRTFPRKAHRHHFRGPGLPAVYRARIHTAAEKAIEVCVCLSLDGQQFFFVLKKSSREHTHTYTYISVHQFVREEVFSLFPLSFFLGVHFFQPLGPPPLASLGRFFELLLIWCCSHSPHFALAVFFSFAHGISQAHPHTRGFLFLARCLLVPFTHRLLLLASRAIISRCGQRERGH